MPLLFDRTGTTDGWLLQVVFVLAFDLLAHKQTPYATHAELHTS